MRGIVAVLLTVGALPISIGQSYGSGIGKSTWAANDPTECYDFINTYFPVVDSSGNCDNHECDVQGVKCNTQARSNLNDQTDVGIHMVNCTHHPSGPLTLAQLERHFSDGVGDFSEFNALMDYNTGLYTHDLDSVAEAFLADNVTFLALRWPATLNDDEDTYYYSLLVNACGGGWVQFEVIGDSLSKSTLSSLSVSNSSYPRLSFENLLDLNPEPDWTMVKISRATANMAAVKEYYSLIGASVLVDTTYTDGVSVLEAVIVDEANIHLQFWDHTGADRRRLEASGNATALDSKKKPSAAYWSVADFESYLNDVHAETLISDVCGFNQLMDNHIAYNVKPRYDQRDLSDIADTLTDAGHLVHWWKSKGDDDDEYVVYSPDPTGWIIGYYGESTSPPENAYTYGASCAASLGNEPGDCASLGYCPDGRHHTRDLFA